MVEVNYRLTFNPSLYIYYNITLYICQVEYTMKGLDFVHKDIVHCVPSSYRHFNLFSYHCQVPANRNLI